MLHLPATHVHGTRDAGLKLHRVLLNPCCEKGTPRVVEWDGGHYLLIKSNDVILVVTQILEVARKAGCLDTCTQGLTGALSPGAKRKIVEFRFDYFQLSYIPYQPFLYCVFFILFFMITPLCQGSRHQTTIDANYVVMTGRADRGGHQLQRSASTQLCR